MGKIAATSGTTGFVLYNVNSLANKGRSIINLSVSNLQILHCVYRGSVRRIWIFLIGEPLLIRRFGDCIENFLRTPSGRICIRNEFSDDSFHRRHRFAGTVHRRCSGEWRNFCHVISLHPDSSGVGYFVVLLRNV